MAGDTDITWSIPYFWIPKAVWNLSIRIWGHRGRPTGKPLSEVLNPRQVARAAQREVKREVPGWGDEQSKTGRGWSTPNSRDEYNRTMDLLDAVDVYEAAQAAKRKLEDERQKAAKKEAQQRAQQQRDAAKRAAGRDTVRPFARGAFTTSALGSLVIGIGDEVLARQRAQLRERGKRLKRLRTNRRGALASSGFQPTGSTNRRGALATRASGTQSAGANGSGVRNGTVSSQSGNQSGVSPGGAVGSGESAASRAARQVMQGSKSLPSAVSQAAASRNPLLELAQLGLVSAVSSPTAIASRSSTATTTRTSTTRTTSSSTRSRPEEPLTGFNMAGVSSDQAQDSKECKCPKPREERKKPREPRCRNPVISRTVKDGIRTTRTRLTCLSFKMK